MKNKAKLVGIVVVSLLALGEIIVMGQSIWSQQSEQAVTVSSELVTQLSILDSSMRSGDQAQFDNSQSAFSAALATFSRNIFAKRAHSELIAALKQYEQRVKESGYVEESRQMAQARGVFLSQLSEIPSEEYDFANLAKLKTIFEEYKNTISSLDLKMLSDSRNQIVEAVDLSQRAIKKIGDCIGICTDAEFTEYQNEFSTNFSNIVSELDRQNSELVEYFNASDLARQLSEIAKNS